MDTRVAIVTQDDPFYMPLFFESFFDSVPNRVEINKIVTLNSFDESVGELIGRMYRLYGLTNFYRRGIEFARRKLINQINGKYSISSIANENDVPISKSQSVNTTNFVSQVEERAIDVILSVSSPEIFGPELLSAPQWGCLNVHTSKLPSYRGMLPTFWALYHGESDIGVTVHTMEEEIDRGKIVRQTTFPVNSASLDDAIKRGKRVGGKLAAKALDDVARGEVSFDAMEGEESYYSFPTVEDRIAFQRRGGKLL